MNHAGFARGGGARIENFMRGGRGPPSPRGAPRLPPGEGGPRQGASGGDGGDGARRTRRGASGGDGGRQGATGRAGRDGGDGSAGADASAGGSAGDASAGTGGASGSSGTAGGGSPGAASGGGRPRRVRGRRDSVHLRHVDLCPPDRSGRRAVQRPRRRLRRPDGRGQPRRQPVLQYGVRWGLLRGDDRLRRGRAGLQPERAGRHRGVQRPRRRLQRHDRRPGRVARAAVSGLLELAREPYELPEPAAEWVPPVGVVGRVFPLPQLPPPGAPLARATTRGVACVGRIFAAGGGARGTRVGSRARARGSCGAGPCGAGPCGDLRRATRRGASATSRGGSNPPSSSVRISTTSPSSSTSCSVALPAISERLRFAASATAGGRPCGSIPNSPIVERSWTSRSVPASVSRTTGSAVPRSTSVRSAAMSVGAFTGGPPSTPNDDSVLNVDV